MKTATCTRLELTAYLNDLLKISHFKDYCPNGLQVQGKKQINHVITGVSATLALIEAAIEHRADAIVVHHGWFWKNDNPQIVGQLHQRLKLLLAHDINLYAYHLPLDCHPELGNNAQLAKVLGIKVLGQSVDQPMIWHGEVKKIKGKQLHLGGFASHVEEKLKRKPIVIGELDRPIKTVAWCTGAAQGYFAQAVDLGADLYISGEISEQTTHLARESGTAYISAGHHATERYGIFALGEKLATHFGIRNRFIDIPNPV
ncbi:MAG: Nif3-like dinuclear metal center hexameric protein [Betaproteobacteria bacterium]|jgi:dinuclear metal center YbgI/SA1388 family protein